jgi:hypothetical protein
MPAGSVVSSTAPRPCKYVKGGNVKSGTAAQFHSSQKVSPRANSAAAAFKMPLATRPQGRRLLLGVSLVSSVVGDMALSFLSVIIHNHLSV